MEEEHRKQLPLDESITSGGQGKGGLAAIVHYGSQTTAAINGWRLLSIVEVKHQRLVAIVHCGSQTTAAINGWRPLSIVEVKHQRLAAIVHCGRETTAAINGTVTSD